MITYAHCISYKNKLQRKPTLLLQVDLKPDSNAENRADHDYRVYTSSGSRIINLTIVSAEQENFTYKKIRYSKTTNLAKHFETLS